MKGFKVPGYTDEDLKEIFTEDNIMTALKLLGYKVVPKGKKSQKKY